MESIGMRRTGTPNQIIPPQKYKFISEQKKESKRKCSKRKKKA
jgi:hypothetical protein